MNLIETKAEAPHSVHPFPFPIVSSELKLEAAIKVENQSQMDDDLREGVVKCELVEFHNGDNSDAPNLNHNNVEAVMFEKIPRTEIKIIGNDEPTTSVDEQDYRNAFSDNDDLNSDPDPGLERDPFGDIYCDPSFSRNSQSNNDPHDDSATEGNPTQVNHSSNDKPAASSAKIILPSDVSAANTTKSLRHPKTLASFLQCQLCLEAQGSKEKLETHVKICVMAHENRDRFCVLCNKLFCRPVNYRLHARTIHGMKEMDLRFFKCGLCPTSFAYKEKLIAHSALHQEQEQESNTFKHTVDVDLLLKPFKCQEKKCKKAFRTHGHLQDHLRSAHSEERPFKCQESNCNKAFKLSVHLRKHMFCHSDKKPFQCLYSDCNKRYKNKERLVQHLRVHNAGRT